MSCNTSFINLTLKKKKKKKVFSQVVLNVLENYLTVHFFFKLELKQWLLSESSLRSLKCTSKMQYDGQDVYSREF